jgi:hypothetical protein
MEAVQHEGGFCAWKNCCTCPGALKSCYVLLRRTSPESAMADEGQQQVE